MLSFKNRSPLLLYIFSLSAIGLIFISLSSLSEAQSLSPDPYFFFKKQIIWLVVAIVSFVAASKIKIEFIKSISIYFYLLSLLLLLVVLLPQFTSKILGARRWLNFYGLFGIQPSEIFKISTILFFPHLFSQPERKNIKNLLLFLLPPFVLIILEPNLSTAVLVTTIIFSIYYLAGGKIIPLFALCSLLIAISLVLISTSSYRSSRLQAMLSPNDQKNSYHNHQISLALASGGIFGKGFANSDQKYRFIPKIATDSIMSIIAEELGFFGSSSVILLFILLVNYLSRLSQKIPDQYQALIIGGTCSWIAIQALINLSAIVAVIPLTGIPLPFVSYGGSSLVSIFTALGLVHNIEKHHNHLLYSNHAYSPNHYHRHPPHSRHRINSPAKTG